MLDNYVKPTNHAYSIQTGNRCSVRAVCTHKYLIHHTARIKQEQRPDCTHRLYWKNTARSCSQYYYPLVLTTSNHQPKRILPTNTTIMNWNGSSTSNTSCSSQGRAYPQNNNLALLQTRKNKRRSQNNQTSCLILTVTPAGLSVVAGSAHDRQGVAGGSRAKLISIIDNVLDLVGEGEDFSDVPSL
jgi:hypothetical protein